MAQFYSKFTYDDINALGIHIKLRRLFNGEVVDLAPSPWLQQTLDFNLRRPIGTEKAKSELIITPILNEMVIRNNESITFFSGYNFDVDKKKGLKGHVDFLLSHETQLPYIEAPTFCIVEAKNDNLDVGIPQCIAEMYAAQLFNHRRGKTQEVIYGTVTSGLAWQFMKLTGNDIVLDDEIYYLNQLSRLIGILQIIVDAK
jgi:hypothetical protein